VMVCRWIKFVSPYRVLDYQKESFKGIALKYCPKIQRSM
jgi:hypothetical protein